MKKQYKEINCIINGEKVSKICDVRASLTDFLRDDFSLHSVKKGCEVGECGACTVIIDGKTYDSCIYLAIWADGKEITTTEGLMEKDGSLSDLQQNFISEGAVQCGFCTPGMLMSAEQLLRDNKDRKIDREEIRRGMAGNLCRCTGYMDIVNAVEKTAKLRENKQ